MLSCQRDKFDIPTDVHYLNCAYQAPLMHSVVSVGTKALVRRQKPYLDTPEIFFAPQEELKRRFALLIGTSDHERIAVIPSVSYGMANAASNIALASGDNVVITAEQFPSNFYAWSERCKQAGAELRVISEPDSGQSWSEAIMASIDLRTRVVTMGTVHWTDGTKFDIATISEVARAHEALVVIDGTQSIGALPFDFDSVRPDALICSGYKWLLGNYSLCLGYYGPYFDDKAPIENNWITRKNSDDFQNLVNYQDAYRPKAYRFTVGQPSHFVLLPMLTESIGQLLEWTPAGIQEYCRQLLHPYLSTWRDMGFRLPAPVEMCAHLFGIRIPSGLSSSEVVPILRRHNVHVSFRGNALRVSLHLWNTPQDLDALTAVLDEIKNAAS